MSDAKTKSAPFGRGLAMRGFSAAIALAVLGSSTSVAFAQGKAGAKAAPAKPAAKAAAKPGDKKAAGAAFKKGKEAFEKKDYKTAKESFTEAEEILPAPTAEYYIARSHEELGDHAEAAKWYEKALGGKLTDTQAADAKSRLEALKAKPAKVKVTSDPPGATIVVDGKPVPEKTPAEIELPPGTHKITLQATGHKESEQSVEVAAFTGATLNTTLDPAPIVPAEDPFAKKDTTPATTTAEPAATTPATPAPEPKKDMTWVYVTGGAAIVALGVGTFFGIQALGDKKDFDDATAPGGAGAAAARDARDSGTRNALISDMGFGIGITLAVTSAVLFFTRPAPEEKAAAALKPTSKMSFAPVVTPTSGGVAAQFSF